MIGPFAWRHTVGRQLVLTSVRFVRAAWDQHCCPCGSPRSDASGQLLSASLPAGAAPPQVCMDAEQLYGINSGWRSAVTSYQSAGTAADVTTAVIGSSLAAVVHAVTAARRRRRSAAALNAAPPSSAAAWLPPASDPDRASWSGELGAIGPLQQSRASSSLWGDQLCAIAAQGVRPESVKAESSTQRLRLQVVQWQQMDAPSRADDS